MNQLQNDPWHTGPLAPGPGAALTTEDAAEFAAYDNYVHSMQMTDIGGRAESDPNWVAPAWPTTRLNREADRQAENEAEAEAEP